MNTAYPEAILFDLDDTILAFDASAYPAWLKVCSEFALTLGVSPDELYGAIQESRKEFWSDPLNNDRYRLNLHDATKKVVAKALLAIGLIDPEVGVRLADDYRLQRDKFVELFPGAVETLSRLGANGVKLGLVTNGDDVGQRKKIERFKLEPYFDSILIEGEFGLGKPAHRVFLHSLEKLETKCDDAWMVGDSLHYDIAPALELGLIGIWVDRQNDGLPNSSAVRPDRIVNTISELVEPSSE